MKNIVRILGGLLLTALFLIIALARLTFEFIGASTAPDDFALLQERMPAVTNWLFSTPWWVPAILLVALCVAGAWLIWSGTQRTAQDEVQELRDGLTQEQVELIITERIRAEFVTQAQGHGTDIRINQFGDIASAANKKVEALAKGVESLNTKLAELERQWNHWTHSHSVNQDKRFRQLDSAFRAIISRERMIAIGDEIEEEGVWLTRIADGEAISDWDEWNNRRASWLSRIDSWIEIASVYHPTIDARFKDVETEEIEQGRWLEGDVEWPDFGTKVAYRKACILLKRFRTRSGAAYLSVANAAFHSPSMIGHGVAEED